MSRFLNIDLHCSVIEDVDTQFRALGHTVDIHMMSGHNWVTGRSKASAGTGPEPNGKVGVGSLHLDSWGSFFDDIVDDVSEIGVIYDKAYQWYYDNKATLSKYDGYVVTYPPAFALLYEHAPGHTILNIPIRYEGPHFTNDPKAWNEFNTRLRCMHDTGKLTVVANSLYDKAYFEYFTGLPCKYISSTCDYVDTMGPKWSPRGNKLLAFGEHSGCRVANKAVPDVLFVRDVLPQYRHEEIAMTRGIVWIPYNCSIMSFFEHYWMNIPMFVPTRYFLESMRMDGLALSQLSWHKSLFDGSNLSRVDSDFGRFIDPHTDVGMLQWMPLYDFYNIEEFPHITYFDSWADLADKIKTTDLESISKLMAEQNVVRKSENLKKWADVLANVKR